MNVCQRFFFVNKLRNERVLIIMCMYENGMALEEISKIVKIPMEDIKQLLNKEEILEL